MDSSPNLVLRSWFERARTELAKPVPALPIDIFRVLAGVLLMVYFLTLIIQVRDFSSPDGLIDHRLLQKIFWFTRLGLFHPGLPEIFFYIVFGCAIMACACLVLGFYLRPMAMFAYLIAVSTYRWNFVSMYVDDSIMHLTLLWLILLPVGHTLTWQQWRQEGSAVWAKWLHLEVEGTAMRCFIGNMMMVYLVAGLWKFESPLWREGFALYATLKLAISWAPDFWQPHHLPWLKIGDFFGLAIEPLLPILLLRRPYHLWKWLGLAGMVLLHGGIMATMRVPFANWAMLAAAVLYFRTEIMDLLNKRLQPQPSPAVGVIASTSPRLSLRGKLSVALVFFLLLSQTRRLPVLGPLHKPGYAVLWLFGVAQDYQLFNWIDRKNLIVDVELTAKTPQGEEARDASVLFPTNIRAMLLQSYLYGLRWIPMPPTQGPAFTAATLQRVAERYCKKNPQPEDLIYRYHIARLVPKNLDLHKRQTRELTQFACRDGHGVILTKRWTKHLAQNTQD